MTPSGAFRLRYGTLPQTVHRAIAAVIRSWYERVAAVGAEMRSELLTAVSPLGAG
jgi:hypothetical protein